MLRVLWKMPQPTQKEHKILCRKIYCKGYFYSEESGDQFPRELPGSHECLIPGNLPLGVFSYFFLGDSLVKYFQANTRVAKRHVSHFFFFLIIVNLFIFYDMESFINDFHNLRTNLDGKTTTIAYELWLFLQLFC